MDVQLPRYRSLAFGGIWTGAEKTSAKTKTKLEQGEEIIALATQVVDGEMRIQMDRGWISAVAANGAVLLEPVDGVAARLLEVDSDTTVGDKDEEASCSSAPTTPTTPVLRVADEGTALAMMTGSVDYESSTTVAEEGEPMSDGPFSGSGYVRGGRLGGDPAFTYEASEPERYRSLGHGTIWTGADKSSAKTKAKLSPGDEIIALATQVVDGEMRIQMDRGWISAVAANGAVLLEPVDGVAARLLEVDSDTTVDDKDEEASCSSAPTTPTTSPPSASAWSVLRREVLRVADEGTALAMMTGSVDYESPTTVAEEGEPGGDPAAFRTERYRSLGHGTIWTRADKSSAKTKTKLSPGDEITAVATQEVDGTLRVQVHSGGWVSATAACGKPLLELISDGGTEPPKPLPQQVDSVDSDISEAVTPPGSRGTKTPSVRF
jgi:hypothetical protein